MDLVATITRTAPVGPITCLPSGCGSPPPPSRHPRRGSPARRRCRCPSRSPLRLGRPCRAVAITTPRPNSLDRRRHKQRPAPGRMARPIPLAGLIWPEARRTPAKKRKPTVTKIHYPHRDSPSLRALPTFENADSRITRRRPSPHPQAGRGQSEQSVARSTAGRRRRGRLTPNRLRPRPAGDPSIATSDNAAQPPSKRKAIKLAI